MFSIIGFHTCEDRGETDEEIRIQLCLFDKNVTLTLENVIRYKEDSYEYVQS